MKDTLNNVLENKLAEVNKLVECRIAKFDEDVTTILPDSSKDSISSGVLKIKPNIISDYRVLLKLKFEVV